MKKGILIASALLAALAPSLLAQRVALVGGAVHPVSSPPISNGTVLISGDRIEAVGESLRIPSGYERVDVSGHSVFPGLINAYTVLGLNEYGGLVPPSVDTNESADPVTPHMRVADAFHLDSRNIPVVRRYGVTNALTTPGQRNVFAGQSAFISLRPGLLSDVIVRAPVASHINLGQPPRGTYGPRNKMPMTRMGIAAMVRQTLIKAREYAAKKERDPEAPTDYMLESLVPVVGGELPVIMRAQRLDDLMTALQLTEEFGLRTILSHAADAYKIADRLAEAGIPVLLGPVTTQPASIETAGAIYENAARLAEAGVRFAIITGGAQQAGRLPYEAGIASAYGLARDEALKAVTLNPARILGLEADYGSLEAGKKANIIVTDGLILQPRSRVRRMYIDGQLIDLETWQEELYEKYRD